MARSRVHLVGTGTAFQPDGRGSTSLLLGSEERLSVLVDVGPTVPYQLNRQGYDTDQLDRVLITHLHGDHTAGWPFLLLGLAFSSPRSRPLEVIGPVGTRSCLAELAALSYGDLLEASGLPFELRVTELPVERSDDLSCGEHGLRVFPMEHHPTSLGYALELPDSRVGFSGDTRWCPALESLASGLDLLFLECTDVQESGLAHVSLEELREGRGRLGSRRVVLVHLDDAVATALAGDPIAGVVAGHDGMDCFPADF